MVARAMVCERGVRVFARVIDFCGLGMSFIECFLQRLLQPVIGNFARNVPCFSFSFSCTMAEGDVRADAAAELLNHIGDEQAQRAAALEERRRALQEERKALAKEIQMKNGRGNAAWRKLAAFRPMTFSKSRPRAPRRRKRRQAAKLKPKQRLELDEIHV